MNLNSIFLNYRSTISKYSITEFIGLLLKQALMASFDECYMGDVNQVHDNEYDAVLKYITKISAIQIYEDGAMRLSLKNTDSEGNYVLLSDISNEVKEFFISLVTT